jgi:hypothetical protein
LNGTVGATVTIDTTTNASLYLTNDAFADIVNALYAHAYITVTSPPNPFPRPTGVPEILHGDGSPEGVVFAPQGSSYMRRDNSGSQNALYAKTTGPSLNTGWQAFASSAAPAPATSLPPSPSNGQQTVLVDSTSAPTFWWFLQYYATAAKWYTMGGGYLYAEDTGAAMSFSNTTFAALPRAVQVTAPRPGLYEIVGGANFIGSNVGSSTQLAAKLGSAATSATEMLGNDAPAGGGGAGGGARPMIVRAVANAGDIVALNCLTGSGAGGMQYPWLGIRPVYVT